MKLAESLSIRKDLQKRIDQISERINNNVKVQEGDQPNENPKELFAELDACLSQLQDIIYKINLTNIHTQVEGVTLTQLMAERDVLSLRLTKMRAIFNNASATQDRYSRSEIKMVVTVDVKKLTKEIDLLSAKYRQLDIKIQAANFATELLES